MSHLTNLVAKTTVKGGVVHYKEKLSSSSPVMLHSKQVPLAAPTTMSHSRWLPNKYWLPLITLAEHKGIIMNSG